MRGEETVDALCWHSWWPSEAWAATVVLTGGKRLDVASYSVSGSYVTVQYANGRRESYPLSAVDLAATRAASGQVAAPPAAAAESAGRTARSWAPGRPRKREGSWSPTRT